MRTDGLPPGVSLLRNGVFGRQDYGSSYLLAGVGLVDPGTSKSLPDLVNRLKEENRSLSDIEAVLLTHIHLDHCGAVGRLVEEVPDLKVYVHEKGAPHLAEPADLLESVKKATGKRFDQYGDLKPVPEENLYPIRGKQAIEVGRREIIALPTPGHAPHHLVYFDGESGGLFTGDAAGLYLKGSLFPATPPPSFNLEESLESLEKMEGLGPSKLLFSHFGPADAPTNLLDTYRDLLESWVRKVESLHSNGLGASGIAERISESREDRFASEIPFGELEMNVEGVLSYLAWRDDV
ncbi:MAG: MBL fold metallo-hydrolase [Candidatus Acetothermia bacterium]